MIRSVLGPILLLALAGSSAADDWTRWRGPDGDGVSKETGWKPEALAGRPRVKWQTNVGAGHSNVVVAGDRLYTMGNQGGKDLVSCLDVETGRPVWRLPYRCSGGGFPGPRATPVLDGGNLYTLSRVGNAFCLEADTGKLKWQKDLIRDYGAKNVDYGLAGSPLIVGDLVVYNACSAGLALDKATGEKKWSSRPGNHGYATAVRLDYQGTDSVAIFSAGDLSIVDVASGRRLDSVPWRTSFEANSADPLSFDSKVFITSGWDRGCALLDVSGGRARAVWENKNLRGQVASPVHLNGYIYGIDDNTPNGRIVCLDARTGESRWAQKGGFEAVSAAGGKLLAIDKTGVLTVCDADPAGFKQVARVKVFARRAKYWTAPVLANGRLYCRSSKGDLVCYDLR